LKSQQPIDFLLLSLKLKPKI